MKKWKVLDKTVLIDSPMFRFMQYDLEHGEKQTLHKFYILDTTDWVNIIPLTSDNRLVLIRQYRAGVDQITVEIPGGIMDKGETDPIVTARRELEEETGYVAGSLEILGFVYPNPSFMTNKCYFVLARDVEPRGKINFDPSEYIETFTVPISEYGSLIEKGEITHSLSVAAFSFLQRKYPQLLD
jgi:8-oxo-dGTP pyrophosphatase MutT (NUDIX family)